jgi:putative ABC transport system permease protein
MTIVRLALASLWHRRVAGLLTAVAIALSVALLLGVEKVRRDARETFTNTISGTDLIVGARSGSVQLLLYTVFRIGNATNNVNWDSYREIAAMRDVKWTVPLSLGDSHRGYRVLGTTKNYFEHYRFGAKQQLGFDAGKPFASTYEAVLGADVARILEYRLGQDIVIAHGTGIIGFEQHDDQPFTVAGILSPTGTPVDRTVHVSLQGIEAIHADFAEGRQTFGLHLGAPTARDDTGRQNAGREEDHGREDAPVPDSITGFLVGVERKTALFRVMRRINQYRGEPLLAVIPGVALQELWDVISVAEDALRVISAAVVATGMLGMLTLILSTLEARRREIAVLRSVGARPLHVFALFVIESTTLATAGVVLGTGSLYAVLLIAQPVFKNSFGIYLPVSLPSTVELGLMGAVVLLGALAGVIPGVLAYRRSLSDGLSMRF